MATNIYAVCNFCGAELQRWQVARETVCCAMAQCTKCADAAYEAGTDNEPLCTDPECRAALARYW